MCDPSNPIAGGACPVQNTGPPPVVYPLMNAIKEPRELRSRREGSWNAIGDNVKAIDYYIKTLGSGPQYQGFGKRVVYDTGIKCSNMPGNAHRLADGTSAGPGGYGLVPRMLGGIGGLVPSDIISSAKDEIQCQRVLLHYNTKDELNSMERRGTRGVPRSNKVKISKSSGGVNYSLVNELCRKGRLSPCTEKPVATQDIQEGFTVRRSSGNQSLGSGTERTEGMLIRMMYVLISVGVLGGIGIYLLK
jgi:hypothetical protein